MPTAEAILAGAAPLSLTENIYNLRGQVEESRRYNVSVTTGTSFTSSFTYYDHDGRVIESRSPGAPVQQFVYDAKGRQIVSRSMAETIANQQVTLVEITRTETTYDANDRAKITTQYERVGAAGNELSASNSVQSWTHTWYDDGGKVIATASFGTNSDVFGNDDPPPTYCPNAPPVVTDGDGNVTAIIPNHFNDPAVLITGFAYDGAGRQHRVFHPDQTITHTEYDNLGRQLLTVENWGATDAELRRVTAYQYDLKGRLSHMAAVLPEHASGGVTSHDQINWNATDGSLQVTEFVYNATVVDRDNNGYQSGQNSTPISGHNAWVGEVRYPHRTTGASDANSYLRFTYYSDGAVASRTDARGVTFHYDHDAQGRLTDIWIDFGAAGSPAEAPESLIGRIEYDYDAEGKLTRATAYDLAGTAIVAESQAEYDAFDNLVRELQQIGGAVNPANSPRIDYDWDFQSAFESGRNYNRLDVMTYPQRLASATRREIHFGYGNSTSSTDIDDALSRITEISDPASNASAKYNYAGMSRRAGLLLGCGVLASFASGSTNSLPGLDRFGRIADLHYVHTGGTPVPHTIHRYQYAYDQSGNRRHARVQQWPFAAIAGIPAADHRSYAYEYDQLQRLISADLGLLDAGSSTVPPAVDHPWRAVDWSLDNVGNWSAGELLPTDPPGTLPPSVMVALDADEAGSGSPVMTRIHHDADGDNTLKSISKQEFPATQPAAAAHIYNRGGNLVWDATYFYVYDAWSRLVAVYDGTVLTNESFNADGRLVANASPGPWMQRLTYDAVGRLVRRETPVLAGATAPEDPIRREDYRYDGVRRIQEIVVREYAVVVEELGSGGEGIEEPKEVEPLDPMFPLELITALPAGWDQREYVWGPDYVDELAWEIAHPKSEEQQQAHPNGIAYYAVLDANYNLMALLRSTPTGAGETTPTQGGTGVNGAFVPGDVAVQYVWSPYGECLASEVFDDAAPLNPVGHQGLFFIRLNGKITDKPHEPYHGGVYYNRNRMYEPASGRFVQRDMNATGQSVIAMPLYHGSLLLGGVGKPDLRLTYRDGANLLRGVGSNPILNRDPLGLSFLGGVAEFGIPDPSDFITSVIRTLVEDYSERLSFDVEWAVDWSADDYWHSRWDNKWVLESMGRGLYEAFDVDLGFVEFNPLDWFGGGDSTFSSRLLPGDRFPNRVRQLGKRFGAKLHHIATPYGTWGLQFRKLFRQAGMELGDLANCLPMRKHHGPHLQTYHSEVYRRLSGAVGTDTGAMAKRALTGELRRIGSDIQNGKLVLND